MFMVLSSWQSHYESSPGSFDECRCDAMHKRGFVVMQCLSVRLSRSWITSKRIFTPSGIVFPHQTGCRYSDGKPLTGASNARGV